MTVERPRVLHVFSTFVPAGPQVRTARLLEAFGDRMEHSIVAMDGRTEARELLAPGLDVRFLPPPPKAGSLATAVRMRRLLEHERFDLVLTYNFGAIDTVLAARRTKGVRLIHHEDGFRPDEARGFKRRREWLRRHALRAAYRVVVISQTLRTIAIERWHLPPQRVAFIPNGIDAGRFAPADRNAPLRASLSIPEASVLAGAVGHLRPEKNLQRLFLAAAAVPPELDLHVMLLGEGPERPALEELALRPPLAGRVHFCGYHPDPREHYRAMDLFALSSDTEQMPIALLEAMASSLPVAATGVGDVALMLPPEQAPYVVKPGRSAAPRLARALEALARDPDLRRTLGAANRARVAERFALDSMVAAYRELYEAALALPRS